MPAVAFCLDDKPAYLMLLRVAVRSLRHVYAEAGSAPPELVCVYAGDDPNMLDAIAAEGVCLARYKPILDTRVMPLRCQRAAGCFLKLELALVPELAAYDTVLYCDTDVMFIRPVDELFAMRPPYMAMAREWTAPFFHEHAQLSYTWRDKNYTVPMPFPIWTFSSGVVVFNLERLRRTDYIYNFLAFCADNADRIGNLDQSLLNYFFGKRITRLDECWNMPPYHAQALHKAAIMHFHGPKPWDLSSPYFNDLRINDFEPARARWKAWLHQDEAQLVAGWEHA